MVRLNREYFRVLRAFVYFIPRTTFRAGCFYLEICVKKLPIFNGSFYKRSYGVKRLVSPMRTPNPFLRFSFQVPRQSKFYKYLYISFNYLASHLSLKNFSGKWKLQYENLNVCPKIEWRIEF